MSEIGDVFTELGVTELPAVFAEVMPDLMDIDTETNNSDSGGGNVKASTAAAYSSVPVSYEPTGVETRFERGGQQLSQLEYRLTFPAYETDGTRITVTPSHRLKVLARDAEPIKTFRIVALADLSGVYWEAICIKEN